MICSCSYIVALWCNMHADCPMSQCVCIFFRVNWNGAIIILRVWRNTITIHDIGSVPLHFHKSLKYTIAYLFDQLSEFLDQTALIFLLCPSSLFHFIRADQRLGIASCSATPQLVCVPPHATVAASAPEPSPNTQCLSMSP